jgi:hypothetical protein
MLKQDAAITLKLWHQFKPEIMKQSLNDVMGNGNGIIAYTN